MHTHHISIKKWHPSQLDLLKKWFKRPHVSKWWSLSDEEIDDEYSEQYVGSVIFPYIVYFNDTPIGFIQYYHVIGAGEGWWPDEQDAGTVGIDQCIGEEAYLGLGIGFVMLTKIIEEIFSHPQYTKIILDVHPENERAIRCYQKAGFRYAMYLQTPDGWANQMELYIHDWYTPIIE